MYVSAAFCLGLHYIYRNSEILPVNFSLEKKKGYRGLNPVYVLPNVNALYGEDGGDIFVSPQ